MSGKRKIVNNTPDLSDAELGISVEDLLELNLLPGVELIAGTGGLNRVVRAVTVMEAPDFIDWVKKNELLLTTGYAISNDPLVLNNIIPSLCEKNLAAFGIKTGRFIDSVPSEMIKQANHYNFPLLKIPYHLSFSDLIMPISQAIDERLARYLKLSEKMHDILNKTASELDGLNYLGLKLYELINNPLSIIVPSLDISIHIPEQSLINQNHNDEFEFTDLEVNKVVDNYKQLDRIERYKVKWKGKDIQKTVFPIVAGSEKLGLLIVWELNQLSRLSIAALERSISIAAYEIMKSFAVIATEYRYKNIVLDQLLTSDIQSFNNARDRARIFGWELEKPYCVFVVKFEEKSRQKYFQKDNYLDRVYYLVHRAIEKISPKLIIAEKGGLITVIASQELVESERCYKNLIEEINVSLKIVLSKYRYHIGVGRIHFTDNGLRLSYDEACKALTLFEHIKNDHDIVFFADLGVWRILNSIEDNKEIEGYIRDMIGEIVEYDRKYNTTFLTTLEVFMKCNGSIRETAEYLGVHYNTVAYRLDRINRLFNINLSDQLQRISVELALLLYKNKV